MRCRLVNGNVGGAQLGSQPPAVAGGAAACIHDAGPPPQPEPQPGLKFHSGLILSGHHASLAHAQSSPGCAEPHHRSGWSNGGEMWLNRHGSGRGWPLAAMARIAGAWRAFCPILPTQRALPTGRQAFFSHSYYQRSCCCRSEHRSSSSRAVKIGLYSDCCACHFQVLTLDAQDGLQNFDSSDNNTSPAVIKCCPQLKPAFDFCRLLVCQ